MFTFQFHLWFHHPIKFLLSYCHSCHLGIVRCLGTVESLFSAATSETTIACGTVTVDHFQEYFGCRVTVQHDWDLAVVLAVPSPFGELHTISHVHPQNRLEIAPHRVKFSGGGCRWQSFECRSIWLHSFFAEDSVSQVAKTVPRFCIEQRDHDLQPVLSITTGSWFGAENTLA